ncbi:hypothetical protein EV401DRAFT_777946 [Pisolithus croceorrhizus]|nr:hypothetical protein EV401DRAFT_777946 [Pisolithus croceorrhizus]
MFTANCCMEPSIPLSQDSGTQPTPILVDVQGNACRINVQAVEFEGRPKLVRALKSAGAAVISDTKDADIILVDPWTECGRRLIRMWGKDPSKVVLNRDWAKLSISTGRPLLREDGWGGMQAVDDGLPVKIDGITVDEEQVDDPVSKSPLPTPRVTPVDSSMPHSEDTNSSHIAAGAEQASVSHAATVPSPAVKYTSPSAVEVPPPSQDQSPFSMHPLQTGVSFPFLASQMQPHVSPTSNPYGPLIPSPSAFQQSMALSAPSFYTAFMTMLEVVARSGSAVNQSPCLGGGTPESQMYSNVPRPSLSSQPTLSTPPLSLSHSQAAVEHTVAKGTEVLPSHRYSADSDQHGSSPGLDVPNSRSPLVRDAYVRSSPRQSSPGLRPSSVSRKQVATIKASRPPVPITKRRRTAVPSVDSDEPELPTDMSPSSWDTSVQLPYPSTPPEPERIILERRDPFEIFSSGGESMNFYVQVDLHRRHNVVSNIKKHKGKIVNNIPDAVYVIASTRAKSYDWLLKEATSLGKIPIQTAFVSDCIDESALLDETPYALEAEARTRYVRCGRHGAFSESKLEILDDKPKSRPSKPKTSVVKAERLQNSPRITPEDSTREETTGSHSPPPPSPATRQRMSEGKYYFTAEESEYFCRFARYHLGRNPSMPTHTLLQRVCEKMPHHSVASWQYHVNQRLKSKLEHIRRKANTAKRQDAIDGDQSHPSQGTWGVREPSESMPYKKRRTSSSPSTITQDDLVPSIIDSEKDPEKEDFDNICSFFASGGGDDDDDERVWQALARHRTCKTARSWPEYYAAHQEAVYTRIEELMAEQVRSNNL